MNNIFENAYFGKAYKTRDGRKMLYLKQVLTPQGIAHQLLNENTTISEYYSHGYHYDEKHPIDCDIFPSGKKKSMKINLIKFLMRQRK